MRKRNINEVARATMLKTAQHYAGHSDLDTTARYYVEVEREEVRDAAADLADRRRGDPEHDEISRLFGLREEDG